MCGVRADWCLTLALLQARHYATPPNLCTQYHFVCTVWMRNAPGICQFKITYFLQISGNIHQNLLRDEGMFITSKDPYFTLSCQLCYGISESNLQATIVSAICLLLASYADFQLEYCAQFCAKWAFTQYSAGQNLLIFIDKSCIGCQFSSSPLLTRWIFSLPRAQSSGQVRWEGEREQFMEAIRFQTRVFTRAFSTSQLG